MRSLRKEPGHSQEELYPGVGLPFWLAAGKSTCTKDYAPGFGPVEVLSVLPPVPTGSRPEPTSAAGISHRSHEQSGRARICTDARRRRTATGRTAAPGGAWRPRSRPDWPGEPTGAAVVDIGRSLPPV